MQKLQIIKINTLLAFAIAIFSSCEEIIDLELKDAKPVVVIEANVSDQFRSQIVKVSQSKPFTQDNTVVPITSATITIKEDGGLSYLLLQTNTQGVYQSLAFAGKPGKKYTIDVTTNGTTYTANSIMPIKVTLDSLSITQLTFFGNTRKFIQVNYIDPANIRNFYNTLLTVNSELKNGNYVEEDRFNDGNVVKNTIFNNNLELKSNDVIKVEFQCVDQNIYKYFYAISQISGNGGPPTAPANPASNFNNGALGYFSAHTSQTITATIK
jgi:hypothetical protein